MPGIPAYTAHIPQPEGLTGEKLALRAPEGVRRQWSSPQPSLISTPSLLCSRAQNPQTRRYSDRLSASSISTHRWANSPTVWLPQQPPWPFLNEAFVPPHILHSRLPTLCCWPENSCTTLLSQLFHTYFFPDVYWSLLCTCLLHFLLFIKYFKHT